MATFPSQEKVTEQGDVIIENDGTITMRAMGARKNDGLLPGQPVNTDIQETPH
jgi:hypothetical protein